MTNEKMAKITLSKLKAILKEFEEDKQLISNRYEDVWETQFEIYRGI